MSYTSLLKMRCSVSRLSEVQFDGAVSVTWTVVADNQRCFIDLNYIRSGKDPVWTPDSGTAQNRSGVLFLPSYADVEPGDRVTMLRGPQGTFEIKSSLDEAWTPTSTRQHHLEVYVTEVDRVYVTGANQ